MAPETQTANAKAPASYEPVAIIGLSCRLPGDARNAEQFWELLESARGTWSEIPKSRFNLDAFYHPDHTHRGTTHVKGGHFLSQDILDFDNSFFRLNAEVAAATDPQLRLQLETTYEAFEDAGLCMEDLAGSRTSVFAGAFHRDHHDSMMKDPDSLPRNTMLGAGTAMLANRISHYFDLRGPSLVADTGCSTSHVILHMACQSLQTGDSTVSVVTSGNVMLGPEPFISMSGLGLLSKDGRCYAFDSRASGYGRGEGAVSLILKLESQAIADGDNIHAVIRSTALNQDGRTPTITSPSPEAQEQLIRECYQKAGLDPAETDYFECHGTGTQVGDLTEATAVRNVFRANKSSSLSDHPLYVGSVKSNIGHLEAAAGLAGIVKVVQAMRHGKIPPNHDFQKPNPKIPLAEWGLKVLRESRDWPRELRRASINSFGYGGSNGHAIIEAPCYPSINQTESVNEPAASRVFVVSGHDSKTCKAITKQLSHDIMTHRFRAHDLAYTLASRRSKLPCRLALRADTLDQLVAKLEAIKSEPTRAASSPIKVGFVFTGQGAQWYAMGRELIERYAVFRNALKEADNCISSLGSDWSIIDELLKDDLNSRVDKAEISMPLCCALQIALVCLLRSWNVHPTAVVGHSSGESAAAFAAGAIDMRSAIAVQYYRGLLTGRLAGARSNKGSMMAAGLSLEDAEQYLSNITSGKAVVGCHNSPLSVTLSGDADAIDELEILLKVDGVFTRKLNVPTAFHSHHMSHDATQYLNYLEECFTAPQDPLLAHLSSSVTGGWCEKASDFGPEHWVDYMLKPVRFADALLKLCSERPWDDIFKKGQKAVDVLIEIGPHGALAAPVRQSLQSTQFKDLQIGYVSALKRNENAVHTMHDLVSSLWTRGYPVDLAVVNSTETQRNRPQVHTTLTPYPWNYQSKLRAESSIAKRYRLRPVGPDELIGFLDTSCDLSNPSWTNNFEPEKLSHDGEQVCSVGVYCSLAGRAIQELASWQQTNGNSNAATPRFRHVEIHEDLHIDDAQLTKLHVELRRSKLGPEPIAEIWRVFTISSEDSSGMWTLHCDGLVGLATTYEGNPDVFSQAGSLAKSSLPPMDSLTRTKPAEASIWELEKATIKEHERQLHEDSQLVALTFMEEALQDLQENPPRRMLPHHRAYKRMITSIVGEARSSQKTSQSTKWAGMFTTGKDELKNRVRVSSTNGQVICCLGENLSQILRGLTDPDEVLSKNHLTKGLLESPSERRSLGQMRAVISKMARESPGIRALQIGAGTKHDTKSILEALSAQRGTQLLVADKCKNRVEHLRTQFKAQENTVTFVQLDIGSATCDPSFEAGSFDLVVAYQAFHECKDIKIALKNVSRLMKPGGKLLFAETTTPLLDMRLCLAVHPSWYIGSEPERKLNPYLSARQWASLLPEVGFGSIDEKLRDCESDDHHSIHLMQATRLLKNSDPAENHSSNLQASCFTQLWRPDVDLISSSQIKDLICNRTVKSSDHLPLDLLEYVCLVYMSEILPWLEQADNLQHAQSGHWQLYAQWIRNCIQQHPSLDAKGPLVEAKIKFARQTIASSESGSIVLGMIDQIGKNIRKIFTREIETLQVMVEGDLHRFYRSAFGISANPSIAQYIGLIADKKQGIRILEIGGGSGGTTYDVLERLRNEDGTSKAILYRFTDISSGFLGKAAEKFSRDSAIMEFSTLNIEKDPSTQGLEEQQFDVIVAANVLHATPNLQKTLKNCHKLLKPNGKLVLGEITERCLYAGFIMGSLPGWWLGENDGRTGGPLLDVAGWDVSLKKAGFSGVDLDMQGINGESPEPMSLVVSTKTPVSKVNGISASKYTIITSGTPICTAFAESIRLALDTENSETDIIAWSDFKAEDIQGSYCISLAEWDAPILATITDKDWQRLRTLMYKSLGTLWVTAGAAMDAPNPSASLMTGLARVFRHEHDNLAFATMDVQLADVIELPVASTAVMRVAITHSHAAQLDSEFAARGPVIYVPRVERASNMSNMLPDVKAHGTQDPIPHTNGVVITEVSSDATYIIAGIGGIGREIGCWLAKKGAKHLVLLSRSATSYKENVIYAKDLYKNHGTSAWLFDCDIADRTALQKVLANIGHLPPVKGVINGAMVMKDVLIENMTTEDLRLAIGPKVYGTLHLHDLLPKDLDFFVMLSSVAGVAGYRGTGNYAGANTFQDAFAFFRRSLGQRATTIDISYLLDVGIVTERDEYAGYMEALGMQSMCISDLLDLLGTALHADSPAQIIYGLPTGQAQPGWYWTNDVRFAGLVTVAQAKPPVSTSTNTRAIQEKLTDGTDVDTTTEHITKALTERLAQLMMLPVTDVDPNEPLSAYGVDSLVAVELRSWILKELKVQVSTSDITADGPMTLLVSKLAAKTQGHE